MAKKQYVGVLNTAANVVKQYIGVSNVARKIVKGYVGVNNVAQQFWGGGGGGDVTLEFEYDYQNYTQYQIHNYLTLEDVIDACYSKFVYQFGSYASQYTHLQYFMDNWQSIKEDVINAIEDTGYNVSNLYVVISSNKSNGRFDSYTTMFVYYGNDAFPFNVRTNTNCKSTDLFGNVSYILRTSESPMPPQTKYKISAYAYANTYNLNAIMSSTGNMDRIGFLCTEGVNQMVTQLASFGVEIV